MAENKTLQEQFFDNIKTGAKWGVPVTIQRSGSATGGLPLDSYSIFDSKAKAEIYASLNETNVKAAGMVNNGYIGQVLTVWEKVPTLGEDGQPVVDDNGKAITHDEVGVYYISEEKTLKPVGVIPVGSDYINVDEDGKITYTGPIYTADGKTMEIGENNVLRIAGSENAQPGTLPVLETVDGKRVIVWKTLEAIGAGDGNSVTEVSSGCACIKIEDEAEDGFEGHKYKVSLNISAEANNQVVEKTDGIYVAETDLSEYAKTGDLVDYTVTVDETGLEDANFKHYIFKQLEKEIAHIDIPKDLVVESGKVEVKEVAGVWGEAGTYIVLTIANQTDPIYVNAKDLVDVYTVADTATVDLTLTGTEIKADVKISAVGGNSLVAKADGLYVNAPTLPTTADAAVEKEYVTAVDQKNGKITVTRKQISYNELADLPTIPDSDDFGVLTVTGKNAIDVIEGQNPEISLVLDNSGNITLTQTDAGLKAEVDLSKYAKTENLPELVYADDNTAMTTKAANTALAIANLTVEGHTITEALGEFVSASVVKDGSVENGGGLLDPTKTYAERIVWEANEAGNSAERKNLPTTLDQVLTLATAETVVVGEGENAIAYRTGHAGLMTPEEKFKLEKLVLDENGSVGISGTISAENVIGLPDKIEEKVTLKGVKINGTALTIAADKTVDIPLATATRLGVVKSAQNVDGKIATNKVYIDAEGVGEVKAISTDLLVQGADELVLNGGNASLT